MVDSAGVSELLRQGIAAAKTGRVQEARRTLLKVAELDERNEQAWPWLS
jgi:Flp pilus assembly protein TadD